MKNRTPQKTSRKHRLWVVVVILAAIGLGIYVWNTWSVAEVPLSATTEVVLGDYVDYVDLRGEITVQSSTIIKAPYSAGELQILKLVQNGAQVKKGDIVVEFDSSGLRRSIDQYRAALAQAESEIERRKAQQSLQEEKNLTEDMVARFTLERARLELGTRDVITALEHERNVLAVAKAEQKIEELETKFNSNRIGAEADLAGVIRKRDKALADLEKAERNLSDLTLRSPIDGTISLLTNSRARTTLIGGSSPIFKEGDRLWAGASIAEIPDLTTLQATAPVFEAERGRVKPGQPVLLRVEAVPDVVHKGTVRDISPITKVDRTTYPYRKSFTLNVDLIQPDPRLKTGMFADIQVEVEQLPDSIIIPVDAVFEKAGRMVAYVVSPNGYLQRTLQLTHRGKKQVRVSEGLNPGDRVTLKDPTAVME
jgi:HlyD family secretion protein